MTSFENIPAKVLPRQKPSIDLQQFEAETVLYNHETKRVHVLNETARMIWDACDGMTSAHKLLEKMQTAFPNVPKTTIERDLRSTLEVFSTEHLVE